MKNSTTDVFKKRLYTFVLKMIASLNILGKTQSNKVISDQLLRSGTSILANFIEAQSASSKKDYINYFTHSLKSSNESKVWVALLRDTNEHKEDFNWLLVELKEFSNIFASSILTLKRGKKKE